ncbi:MAG: SusC/RagA family TonB-linked outer membrane protein [Bacteroidales bacterium]|nr:SusC/RagA family TonB-linked outer membrane protein [Bacteroidales bacterium]
MKNFKLLISTLVLAFAALTAFAQNVKVSGVVTDENGPLPGVAVQVSGTSKGTATNADGSYTITVPSNATLVFSAIGYTDETVAVAGQSVINVFMKEDKMVLEETVVIGYGSGQKISNIVGSVKTVKAESLNNAPSASALDMLQGQVAGLAVLTTGGVAGDNNVSMTLHGHGSLTSGTSPLFVIDGIPSSSRTIMAMNPNDILSISILKDASATSIYGARAANGVVYVTTKSGAYNETATVTIRSQWGISTLADFTMYNNMMSGDELKDFWMRAGIYDKAYIDETYTDHGYTANTKWHEYYQRFNNPQYQNDITVEGGGRKVAYMIGASQFHQTGNTYGNYYDRYTVRSNVQGHPTDWLKVGLNVNFSYDKRNNNGNWSDSGNLDANYLAGGLSMILNPLYPAIDPVTGDVYEKEFLVYAGAANPKYQYSKTTRQVDRYGVVGGAYVEIEPIKNLKIVSRGGIDGSETLFKYNYPASYAAEQNSTAGHSRSSTFDYSATITNTIEYSFGINNNDHRFSFLAGHEGIFNNYDYFWASSAGQTDDRMAELDHGIQANFDMSESSTQSSFLSFFGHADYNFRERYFVDLTLRYDASSRFGRSNRWAPFWAAGFLWKAKRENFLRGVSWLDDLNFKLSYGTQGNAAIGDYVQYATISQFSSAYGGVSGFGVSSPSNYELKWENQGLLSFNVNGRLFNRFDFDIELYNRITTNMLMDVPQPYTAGFTSVTKNVGGLSNRGIDITLGVDILRGRDYFLRFSTTFNYNKETITELFDGRTEWEIEGTGLTYVVGQPVSFYYPLFAGIDPDNGKQLWYVPTGWEEYQETGDVTKIDKTVTRMDKTTDEFDELLTQNTGKKRYAPVTGGFSLSGSWKGLSLQADFSYVLGKYLINNDAFFYNNPNQFKGYNTSHSVTDYWTPSNRYAKYPDWSSGAVMQFDTHLLEPASFLRLKSLIVGYSLPEKALRWSNGVLKGVKVTFTGRNLFTATKFMGGDPEANYNLTLGLPGSTRQFLGGLEITF